MDSLPPEILGIILESSVRQSRCDKNAVLPHRLVCRAFDSALKPYIFKTVQLEFSRFLRDRRPSMDSLERVGNMSEALYIDMMVVRDEEEIDRLQNVFQSLIPKVPEMVPLLDSLRHYCLNENTFEGEQYRDMLERVLFATPNIDRVKLNLPFQVVGQRARTATVLLANTLSCLADRDPEHKVIDTVVMDHVSDTTLIDICHNPVDVGNAIKVFSTLKSLVISIKRQEAQLNRQDAFRHHLWMLLRKATQLKSLCMVGWNIKRDPDTRRHQHGVSAVVWSMRSLPIYSNGSEPLPGPIPGSVPLRQFKHLQHLELKRVDVIPQHLLLLMEETAQTLKEVYLSEVYLKIHTQARGVNSELWIGHSDVPKPENACWVADEIRDIRGLNLDIIRVTCIGYDDFEISPHSTHPNYDLDDPKGWKRSFDQRFVDAVHFGREPATPSAQPTSSSITPDTPATELSPPPSPPVRDYDADTYQRFRNPTSDFKRCIDGYFFNHNEKALRELQKIITVADRGMTLLGEEIDRARENDLQTVAAQVAGGQT